jgi:tetratricopeptide (TPR) repeat protein
MMKFRALLILLLFVCLSGKGQDQIVLDSLQLQLKNASKDSVRVKSLLAIARQYSTHDYLQAVKYAQQARELAVDKQLEKLVHQADRMLATIFFGIGDYKNSAVYFFKALKFFEARKDTMGIVFMNINLGAVQDRLHNYDKALEFYLNGQNLLTRSSLPSSEKARPFTSLYNNIANIYQIKQDFESARQYYEKTLLLARENQNKTLEGIALNNLGKLYFTDLNDQSKALTYLIEGLKVREEVGDKNELAKSYIQLSAYYTQQKNFSEAKRAGEQAIKLGKEVGSLEMQKDGYQSLAMIEEERGNLQESLSAFKLFKKLSDSIQSQMAGSELAKLQLQYDFEKSEQERILEKEQLRTRYTIAIVILAASLLVVILIAFLIRSRARQTELKQKNLSQAVEMKNKELTTNVMYLIRKNELINDVAERLLMIKQKILPENQKVIHDIILDLQREADNDTWKEFEMRFNQVHSDFYDKLRNMYPGLSPADEKLCAFLRLNMSSKEIAAITKQSVKSLEVARARLRKKLNLTNTTSNLVTHLTNL